MRSNILILIISVVLVGFGLVACSDDTTRPTDETTQSWACSAGGTGDDQAESVATDRAGNTFVAGRFSDLATFEDTTLTSAGESDVFMAKYDEDGTLLWACSAGGSSTEIGCGVATDFWGNAVVTGWFSVSATFGDFTLTSEGGTDVFLAKYDSEGAVLWARAAGGSSSARGYGVAIDSWGNAFVTGYFYGSATFGDFTLTSEGGCDVFIAKYDAGGAVLWARAAGSSDNSYCNGWGVATDDWGNVFVTGYFYGSVAFGDKTLTAEGSLDVFIAKYDADGALLWAHSAGGSGRDGSFGVAADGDGNAVIAGSFVGSATFGSTMLTSEGESDVLVAKYDAGGEVLWARAAGGSDDANGFGVATDNRGNAVVTGYFYGSATFGSTMLTSEGRSDVFVAKYDAGGAVLWAYSAGGSEDEDGWGVATDVRGNAIVAGSFQGLAAFGDTTLTSAGYWDVFVAKVTPSGF